MNENPKRDFDEEGMETFEASIKEYEPDDEEFEEFEEDEETGDCGIIDASDFTYLRNLEVLRLMDCQQEIHELSFLRELKKRNRIDIIDFEKETEMPDGKLFKDSFDYQELIDWYLPCVLFPWFR